MTELLEQIIGTGSKGGFVMIPMLLAAGLLWYGILLRYFLLKQTEGSLTTRYSHLMNEEAAHSHGNRLRNRLDGMLREAAIEMGRYRILIHTIVIIAPLMGLLGTVAGMIETFDSLGTAQNTGSGIAGGISTALVTTQTGLVIAIPGLLFDRSLHKKEIRLGDLLYRLRDRLLTGSVTQENSP